MVIFGALGIVLFDHSFIHRWSNRLSFISGDRLNARVWNWHCDRRCTISTKIHLTHWGPVTHISVSKLTTIGSGYGLSPGRCQAIIWTNAAILLNRTLGKKLQWFFSEIHTFSFKKMHLKMSAKWRQFCLGLNVMNSNTLKQCTQIC